MILSDTFVECIYRSMSCALGKWSLHSRWNFISTSTEFHVHDDEHWLMEVTSNTYFRSVRVSRAPRQLSLFLFSSYTRRFFHEQVVSFPTTSCLLLLHWELQRIRCGMDGICPATWIAKPLRCTLQWENKFCCDPFTTKSDQCQISPAFLPEIVHHTVWRTWLFIAYSDERWLCYQISLPHSYISLWKFGRMYFFKLGSEWVNPVF